MLVYLQFIIQNNMNDYLFAAVVFLLAFPFGFWRAKSKFKSRDWMLAIHIPVAIIIVIRIVNKVYFDIGFSWQSLVMNVFSFLIAQYIAGVIYRKRMKAKSK